MSRETGIGLAAGRVAGKVCVVTGAAQGQGLAEALLLDAEGALVYACDLMDEAPSELRQTGRVAYRRLDVTNRDDWATLAGELSRTHGRVDGLVANAGVTWRARLADLEPDDLARVGDVNVTGGRQTAELSEEISDFFSCRLGIGSQAIGIVGGGLPTYREFDG